MVRNLLIVVLLSALLGACGSSGLTDEDAKAQAVSTYVADELARMRAMDPGIPESAVRGAVDEVTVLSNDGQTATVRIKLVWNRLLPPEYVEVEVTLGE